MSAAINSQWQSGNNSLSSVRDFRIRHPLNNFEKNKPRFFAQTIQFTRDYNSLFHQIDERSLERIEASRDSRDYRQPYWITSCLRPRGSMLVRLITCKWSCGCNEPTDCSETCRHQNKYTDWRDIWWLTSSSTFFLSLSLFVSPYLCAACTPTSPVLYRFRCNLLCSTDQFSPSIIAKAPPVNFL